MLPEKRKEKKDQELFLQPARAKISELGPHVRVSPSSETLEETTEFRLGAAQTHACVHTQGIVPSKSTCHIIEMTAV